MAEMHIQNGVLPARICRRSVYALLIAILFLIGMKGLSAGSLAFGAVSVNVPMSDIIYKDLDRLISQGLIKKDLAGTWPLSRLEMARLVEEAREAWSVLPEEERQSLNVVEASLQRLEKAFQAELEDSQGVKEAPKTFVKPVDLITAAYRYQGGHHSVYNNEGLDYYLGHNLVADATLWGRFFAHLGVFAQPRFVVYQNRGNDTRVKGEEVPQGDAYFHKANAKVDIRNFEIQYGTDSLWWGPGYHGAVIMTNNAQPFEMLKVSNPIPSVLPWIFKYLGLFKYQAFLTKLDSYRLNPLRPDSEWITDHDEPYLFGLNLDCKPKPWLELGFNITSLYREEGDYELTIFDHIRAWLANHNIRGDLDPNSQASFFFQLRWYNLSKYLSLGETLSFYGTYGTEDTEIRKRYAVQVGISIGDFLKQQGRLKLQVEYIDASPTQRKVWYTHPDYPPTYEGRIFGHHVGSDAKDLFARLTWAVTPKWELAFQGDYEKRGNSLESSERALQGQLDILYWAMDNFNIFSTMGLEKIFNQDFVEGEGEIRSFFSLQAQYRF